METLNMHIVSNKRLILRRCVTHSYENASQNHNILKNQNEKLILHFVKLTESKTGNLQHIIIGV